MVRLADIGDEHFLQQVLDEASGTSSALIYGDGARDLLTSHTVYIGFVNGRAVGCVMATVDPERALIHNLAVARPFRKQGHATTLVKSAMSQLDETQPRDYWTAADPGNPSTVKRFHLLGFSTYDDGAARDYILMRRAAAQPSTVPHSAATPPVFSSTTTMATSRRSDPPAIASND